MIDLFETFRCRRKPAGGRLSREEKCVSGAAKFHRRPARDRASDPTRSDIRLCICRPERNETSAVIRYQSSTILENAFVKLFDVQGNELEQQALINNEAILNRNNLSSGIHSEKFKIPLIRPCGPPSPVEREKALKPSPACGRGYR